MKLIEKWREKRALKRQRQIDASVPETPVLGESSGLKPREQIWLRHLLEHDQFGLGLEPLLKARDFVALADKVNGPTTYAQAILKRPEITPADIAELYPLVSEEN